MIPFSQAFAAVQICSEDFRTAQSDRLITKMLSALMLQLGFSIRFSTLS